MFGRLRNGLAPGRCRSAWDLIIRPRGIYDSGTVNMVNIPPATDPRNAVKMSIVAKGKHA